MDAHKVVDCDPYEQPDGRWRCRRCGWTHVRKTRRNCPAADDRPPAERILQRITIQREEGEVGWHYYPARSDAEIKRLLGICFACEKYPRCRVTCGWLKRLACVGFRECERW